MALVRKGKRREGGKCLSSKTSLFTAFGPPLFGQPARRTVAELGRLNSLQELYEIFGRLLPERLLAPTEKGINSRERPF
jgi:hypothetical protein